MIQQTITAQFESREQVNCALSSLWQAGAIARVGGLPAGGSCRATLHLSVPPGRTMQVQDILRRSGGTLFRG